MNQSTTKADKPWLRVSYSSLNTFKFCNRKFEFAKIYGQFKERADEQSIPAAVGQAFHLAYQAFIEHRNLDKACWTLLANYPWELDMYDEKNRRTWEVTLSTFLEACDKFALGDYTLMTFDHPTRGLIPCVEVPFELRFVNTEIEGYAGIAFIGYIDLILRSRYGTTVRTEDIKTHQSYIKDRTAEYKYNAQQIPYGIVVEHLLGHKIESFEVGYIDCFLDLVEPRVVEYVYEKTQTDLQEWLTQRLLEFRQIKQMLEINMFPRRENGCTAYNYPCKFLDICASRNRENITAWFGQFLDIDDSWDPWVVMEIDMGVKL